LQLAGSAVRAEVLDVLEESERLIRFSEPINTQLVALGETPLPPYITAPLGDTERYQTVFSREEGSAAAPTAGLHFTPELLIALRAKGVRFAYCTLHIGLGTFKPVNVERIEDYHIHAEYAVLKPEDARLINEAKLAGGRVIAVGTTVARTLETAGILSAGGDPANAIAVGEVCAWRPVIAFESDTNLFIYPGYRWRVVDAMITNFHLPKSSLLMMISSLVGRENLLNAYETAKAEGYRFFSFGDAMFIR
jgi:S-adenosylmethionine:tRNA ribosyltransferase-isomerase